MLFFSLLHGKDSATEARELGQFLLNFLEPFMPLAVGDLSFCFGTRVAPILGIQFLKVRNLSPEIANLFTKDCEMIHDNRIAHSKQFFKRYQENGGGQVWFPFLGIVVTEARRGSASAGRLPEGLYQRRSSLRLKSGSARDDVQEIVFVRG